MCGKDYVPPFCAASVVGITPACAGKTSQAAMPARRNRDHPRMCGKDLEHRQIRFIILGSPPHVRERPERHYKVSSSAGITPACAGKT